MEDRDNSTESIVARYNKANEMAIVTHNRICFDSLRDIFFLLAKVQKLEKEIEQLKSVDRLESIED